MEGYIVTGSKQVEIGEFLKMCLLSILGIQIQFQVILKICKYKMWTGTKLSEDSRKYGAEKTCTSGNTLSRAALSFGRARAQMEKECGILLKALGTQV